MADQGEVEGGEQSGETEHGPQSAESGAVA